MIPFRALLLQRLICSAWSIGAIALVTASLLEGVWSLLALKGCSDCSRAFKVISQIKVVSQIRNNGPQAWPEEKP